MGKASSPFEYFFLISNLYILLIFFFYFIKNMYWFLRTYIIGKTIQLAGILLVELSRGSAFSNSMNLAGFMFILCFPFEIFGIISYDGHFNKKIFHIFLIATIIFCLTDLILISQHIMINVIDIFAIFFYTYGGIVLLDKKDKSRFKYLIAITLLAYSVFVAIITVISIPQMSFRPGTVTVSAAMPTSANFRETYNNVIYFVMIVSSIGYIVVLKEQDEFALDIASEKINKENLALKKLDEEKNKFFSIIAHDLKGPIGTLANLTEMLVESRTKLKQADYEMWLNTINQTTTRTYTLLNNLLLWARSESGTITPDPENIDVKDLIDEVVRLQKTFALSKNIQLTSICPDNIIIFADREMIRTVIRNLISNALKFTNNNGSVLITVKPDKDIIISVTDSGIGINNEVIKNLFALDSNYTTPGTNKEEGSGIGLKLSREFVEKNNGRIWVESTKGKGSTFYVSLPVPRFN